MSNDSLDITDDLLRHTAMMDLAIEFMCSREKIRWKKKYENKKIIGTVIPVVEPIIAAGALPVYAMRMQSFGGYPYTRLITQLETIISPRNIARMVQQAATNKTGYEFINRLINEVVDGIFYQYNRMYDYGIERGVPSDECYGIKVVSGLYFEKGKNFITNVLPSVRCSAWQRMYETCTLNTPTKDSIYLDVPPYTDKDAKDLAVEEVNKAIADLENITGNTVTNRALREAVEYTNKCKIYSKRLIELALGDYYTINPVSFAKILALIEIFFQDYLSDPKRMAEILGNLVKEMERDIALYKMGDPQGPVIDVSNMAKIFFTPRYGGWDYIVGDYAYENNARVIYADWWIYGFLDEIKTQGDMIKNYAEYLISISNGFGPDNTGLVNKIVDFSIKYNVDGVIYNHLFGCHSLTTAYTRLRKELLREEIPSTFVSFNNIGENREQLKTRTIALLEMI